MKEKIKPKIIIIAALVLLMIFPILQNTQIVTLQFFFWELSMSRIILFPLLFFFGALCGSGIIFYLNYRKKRAK